MSNSLINLARVVIRSGPKSGARLGPLTPKMIERSAHLRQTRHGLEAVGAHLARYRIKINPRKPLGGTAEDRARHAGYNVDDVWLHGSSRPGFKSFDDAKLGLNTGARNASLGHFFTDDPSFASLYAGNSGAVLPVWLRMRKPLHLRQHLDGLDGLDPSATINRHLTQHLGRSPTSEDFLAWRRALQVAGHDSIIVTNADGSRSAVKLSRGGIRSVNARFDPRLSRSTRLGS